MEFIKNQFYWVEDPTVSYLAARLLNAQSNQNGEYQMEIYLTGKKILVNPSLVTGIVASPAEITLKSLYDDLTDAVDISEASILWNLHLRYDIQKIYSGIMLTICTCISQ
jgi:myosin heavy subunit